MPIVIGSRDGARAAGGGRSARPSGSPAATFSGFENAEAVQRAELVILSVPFRSQSETLTNLKQALREHQLVIDATVPLAAAVSGKATRTLGRVAGLGRPAGAGDGPRRACASCRPSTPSAPRFSPTSTTSSTRTCSCAATTATTRRASPSSSNRIDGLRTVDCGPLEMARIVEQLTALIISINVRNKARAGIRITGLQ